MKDHILLNSLQKFKDDSKLYSLLWSCRAYRARICKPFSPGISIPSPGGPVRQPNLTYWPASLHMLVESIPWNRFLGSLNAYKFGLSICRWWESMENQMYEAHCVTNVRKNLRYERKNRDPEFMSEPVFVNVYGAQESIPRNRFSQPM